MHPKKKNAIYTSLFNLIKSKMEKIGFEIITKFDESKQEFSIENKHIETGDIIYHKQFGYHKENQRDSLITRAYEVYFTDMFEFGIVLNHEAFITANRI